MRKEVKNVFSLYQRKIFVYVDNSFTRFNGRFKNRSNIITGRTPFNKDLNLIDYEIDSEDELNERVFLLYYFILSFYRMELTAVMKANPI